MVTCLQVTRVRIAGILRLIPIPDCNLLTFSFAYPPDVDLDLSATIGVFKAQLGTSGMLKRAVSNVLVKRFTEPRRRMLAHFVTPPKLPNLLTVFTSAVVTVKVLSVRYEACQHDDVVLHAQMRKVCCSRLTWGTSVC